MSGYAEYIMKIVYYFDGGISCLWRCNETRFMLFRTMKRELVAFPAHTRLCRTYCGTGVSADANYALKSMRKN